MKDEISLKKRNVIRKHLGYKRAMEYESHKISKSIKDKSTIIGMMLGGGLAAYAIYKLFVDEEIKGETNVSKEDDSNSTQEDQSDKNPITKLSSKADEEGSEGDDLGSFVWTKAKKMIYVWLLEEAKDLIGDYLVNGGAERDIVKD